MENNVNPFHWELEFPEVFSRGGFDAIVSNPPFIGGYKISGYLGNGYREYLTNYIAKGKKGGQGDLCAYFFLRVLSLLNESGCCGLIATNTICQGDTREVGLQQLVDSGVKIYRGVSSAKWEGTASLEVSHVWMSRSWSGNYWLDGQSVSGITAFLTPPGRIVGNPYRLVANNNKSFLGSKVYGQGFVLTPEEAMGLIERDERNKGVLFPYLNGEDLNSSPCQSPSRWVINFHDYPLSLDTDNQDKPKGPPYAMDFPDCLDIVERLVKPEREKVNEKAYREKWWLFAQRCPSLYETIKGFDRVLVTARVSPSNAVNLVSTNIVFNEKIVVFPDNSYSFFSLMQSSIHWEWTRQYTSTLGGITLNYSPSDCFETFPFPQTLPPTLQQIGETYYNHRQQMMLNNQQGLTKTYNRFHNPHEYVSEIKTLQQLHTQMDIEVAKAYGWDDIHLNHGFYETKQGLRYTICEEARKEILDRLLELNHQRYAEEISLGLHDKKTRKKKIVDK